MVNSYQRISCHERCNRVQVNRLNSHIYFARHKATKDDLRFLMAAILQRLKGTVSPADFSVLLVKHLTATRVPGLSFAAPPLCITSIRSVVAEAPACRFMRCFLACPCASQGRLVVHKQRRGIEWGQIRG